MRQIFQNERRQLAVVIASMNDGPIYYADEVLKFLKAQGADDAVLEDSRRQIKEVMERFQEASRDKALADLEPMKAENQQLKEKNEELREENEELKAENEELMASAKDMAMLIASVFMSDLDETEAVAVIKAVREVWANDEAEVDHEEAT